MTNQEVNLPQGELEISGRLADDLATQLIPLPAILEKYALNSLQLKMIVDTPQFRVLYAEAKARWNSDTNTEERIRSKSSMMVEDSLLEVFHILHNDETSNSTKLESFKQLTSVADLGPKRGKDNGGSGQRTTITINVPPLGDKPGKEMSITGNTLEHQDEVA